LKFCFLFLFFHFHFLEPILQHLNKSSDSELLLWISGIQNKQPKIMVHPLYMQSMYTILQMVEATVQQRQDNTCITQYWVSSQNFNTQKYHICVVSLSWDNTRVLSLESGTSILYRLRWLIPPKTSLIHKIFGRIEEKTKTIFFHL
jgi:hypothetical protein